MLRSAHVLPSSACISCNFGLLLRQVCDQNGTVLVGTFSYLLKRRINTKCSGNETSARSSQAVCSGRWLWKIVVVTARGSVWFVLVSTHMGSFTSTLAAITAALCPLPCGSPETSLPTASHALFHSLYCSNFQHH